MIETAGIDMALNCGIGIHQIYFERQLKKALIASAGRRVPFVVNISGVRE